MAEPIPKNYPNKRQKPTTKTLNRQRAAERRSERAERRGGLRTSVVDRSGGTCEWPSCGVPAAHMAHIRGIGRGGDPTGVRDNERNVAMLCVWHHDLLDGRVPMKLREVEELLLAHIGHEIDRAF